MARIKGTKLKKINKLIHITNIRYDISILRSVRHIQYEYMFEYTCGICVLIIHTLYVCARVCACVALAIVEHRYQ